MIAFMVALSHTESSNFQQYLEKYLDPLAPYIISLETAKDTHSDTSGQHFHICCQMTDKQYDSFRKTILVKHYQLKGQARDGHARQYGRVRSIRDETKMLQYTVKDKNIIYKNIDLKTIQDLIQASFHRPEKRNIREECLTYLTDHMCDYTLSSDNTPEDYSQIEKAVIRFYREYTDKIISKPLVKNTTTHFLQSKSIFKISAIFNYLML